MTDTPGAKVKVYRCGSPEILRVNIAETSIRNKSSIRDTAIVWCHIGKWTGRLDDSIAVRFASMFKVRGHYAQSFHRGTHWTCIESWQKYRLATGAFSREGEEVECDVRIVTNAELQDHLDNPAARHMPDPIPGLP